MITSATEYASGPAGYSAYGAGWLRKGGVTLQRSVRDLNEDSIRTFVDSYSVEEEPGSSSTDGFVKSCAPSVDAAKYAKMDISKSGRKTIVFRNLVGKDGKAKPVIEVNTQGEEGAKSIKIDASKMHGVVLGDAWFGSSGGDSCFSPDSDERYVVYVAADNQRVYGADPATGRNRSYSTTAGGGKTFFETPTSGFSGTGLVEGESASGGDTDAGTKFEFCDDWGERYTGVHGTKICVLDTMTGSLRVLPSMALQGDDPELEVTTVGQPSWRPNLVCEVGDANKASDKGKEQEKEQEQSYEIAFTQWGGPKGTAKLGMIYCYQRPCAVRSVDVTRWLDVSDTEADDAFLSVECADHTISSLQLARSPRYSPDGKLLVCVGRNRDVPLYSHGGSFQLFKVTLPLPEGSSLEQSSETEKSKNKNKSKSIQCVLDLVQLPEGKLDMNTGGKTNQHHRHSEDQAVTSGGASAGGVVVEPNTFPGLFLDQLPRRPFVKTPRAASWEIVCNTQWGARDTVILVNIDDDEDINAGAPADAPFPAWKRVTRLNPHLTSILYDTAASNVPNADENEKNDTEESALDEQRVDDQKQFHWNDNDNHACAHVLDVEMLAHDAEGYDMRILFQASSPICPQRAGILYYRDSDSKYGLLRVPRPAQAQIIYSTGCASSTADDPDALHMKLKGMRWKIFTHSPPKDIHKADCIPYESILLMPPMRKHKEVLYTDVELSESDYANGGEGGVDIPGSPENHSAATKLQAIHRGKQAKRDVQKLKQEKADVDEDEESHAAATRLQALTRRKKSMRRVEELKEKKRIAEEIGDSEEAHSAAAKLQAIQRGKKAKQEVAAKREEVESHAAATKLQAMQRAKLAKREVEDLKEKKRIAEEIGDSEEAHSAAAKLQAIQRRKIAQKEVEEKKQVVEEENTAATRLQAIQRRKQAQKQVSGLKERKADAEKNLSSLHTHIDNYDTHHDKEDQSPKAPSSPVPSGANSSPRKSAQAQGQGAGKKQVSIKASGGSGEDTNADEDAVQDFEEPASQKNRKNCGIPLILVPHGGPHSCSPTSFIPSYAYLALSLGAAVLHVNYRGSTGYGQASIDSLPGNIGDNDVQDMMTAVHEVVAALNDDAMYGQEKASDFAFNKIDLSRICVVGGSHGGFLTGHLIGQYPSYFAAAAMRNPVTNIPSMVGVTDIPDWCHIEAKGLECDHKNAVVPSSGLGTSIHGTLHGEELLEGDDDCGTYQFRNYAANVTTARDLAEMLQRSPVAHVSRVKTPTLICLGAKDRRVPHSQGIEYYHILRSMGVASKMLIFPNDCHAIDLPCSEAEHFVAIKLWFEETLAVL